MRVVVILLWVLILVAVLLPLLRRALAARSRPAALPDELVKDPVCQTYVLRSRAVRGRAHGEAVYFCSPACARQFEQAEG
jgi:YHS domain-containing protein